VKRGARGLTLAGGLILAAACGGKKSADAVGSPDLAPSVGGAVSSAGGDGGSKEVAGVAGTQGSDAGASGVAAGGGGLADCGAPGEGCCPNPNSLVAVEPCHDPSLQCCTGVCLLACDAPDEPPDAWAARPECTLAPYKACTADSDCTLVEHRVNCCGTTRWVGIAVDAVTDVTTLTAACEPTTTCDCPALELAENGPIDPGTDTEPTFRCRDGACTSFAPPVR
jgi:hypothetical protein